ncbi:hypothetical protein KSF_099110 [Reticulibacter mediterranei]|uniref:Uncharacterized protein n=1 Tax=Reticulibacter mediterranei TaxID=2778369 RepID=A0A8J3N8N0_9CHLR|nr:hypothetical protein KSF_099110 [Reticulibacter mediterranei]
MCGFHQIFDHMKSIRALHRLGSPIRGSFGVVAATISADDSKIWGVFHPGCPSVCLSIREEIGDGMTLQIHYSGLHKGWAL